MGVNLSRQLLGLEAFVALLIITTVLLLLFILGLKHRVLGNRHLVSLPKWRVFGEPDGVNNSHPSLHKPELLGLKDYKAHRVLGMLEALVIVSLLLYPSYSQQTLCLEQRGHWQS